MNYLCNRFSRIIEWWQQNPQSCIHSEAGCVYVGYEGVEVPKRVWRIRSDPGMSRHSSNAKLSPYLASKGDPGGHRYWQPQQRFEVTEPEAWWDSEFAPNPTVLSVDGVGPPKWARVRYV